jgi:hypothetical protein
MEWRGLVAGREGFLVDGRRAGVLRQRVVWGEMDSMVSFFYSEYKMPGWDGDGDKYGDWEMD